VRAVAGILSASGGGGGRDTAGPGGLGPEGGGDGTAGGGRGSSSRGGGNGSRDARPSAGVAGCGDGGDEDGGGGGGRGRVGAPGVHGGCEYYEEEKEEEEEKREKEAERERENQKEKEREKERKSERARIKELEELVKARGGGGPGGGEGGGQGGRGQRQYSTREQLLRDNAQEAEAAAEVAEKTLVSTRAALRLRGMAQVLALKAETRRLRGHRALLLQQAHKAEASNTTLKGRRRAGAPGGGGQGSLDTIRDSRTCRTEKRVCEGGGGEREFVRNVAEASEGARGVVSELLDISAISTADSLSAPAKRDRFEDSSDSSSDGWGGGGGGRSRGGAAGDGSVSVLKNEITELRSQLFKIKREAQQSEMQLRERLEREFAQQLAVNVAQDVEAALQQMHGQNSADVLHNDYLRDEYLRSSAEAVECHRTMSSAKIAARSLLNDLTVCTMEAYLLNAIYLGAPVANTRDAHVAMGTHQWGARVEIPEFNIPTAQLPSSPPVGARWPSSQTHKAFNKKWNERMAASAEARNSQKYSLSTYILTLHSKGTWALTFENFCPIYNRSACAAELQRWVVEHHADTS
jgi:hypothetical protein